MQRNASEKGDAAADEVDHEVEHGFTYRLVGRVFSNH